MFFSVGIDISISRPLFPCLFLIAMSGLLAFMSRSVCIGISQKIVMLSFSVLFRAHAHTISRLFLYSFLCRCYSVGISRLYLVCVGIHGLNKGNECINLDVVSGGKISFFECSFGTFVCSANSI